MSEQSPSPPEPLQPLFDFSGAPEPVIIFRGEAVLGCNDGSHTGMAEVFMDFLPEPRIRINGRFSGIQATLGLIFNDSEKMSFHLGGEKVEGYSTSTSHNSSNDDVMDVQWSPKSEPFHVVGDIQAKASVAAIFHLFNFPDFGRVAHQNVPAPAGRRQIVLQDEKWQVIIQSLDGTKQAIDRAKKEGGCFLTHVGKQRRVDGSAFSGDEATDQHLLIASFLSFVNGGRCWPVCVVGLDAAGERSWETWAAPPASNPILSWTDLYHGHQVEALFPLFSKRWNQSESWGDCLRSAIYWYMQSNTRGGVPGIDAAIILAQSALERLAHHHLVIDRKMISAEGFKKLWVSDQLRLLFSSMDIPIEITGDMPKIQTEAAYFKWKDAPHALTEIRNALVHPESKDRKRVAACYVDAWKLSLWYLELSILAMCGYGGSYGNRLKGRYVGQVENVPWKK